MIAVVNDRSLFRGCTSVPERSAVPTLLIAGVQKGGTSSLKILLAQQKMQAARTGELNFFNHPCFVNRSVQKKELENYRQEWTQNLTFDKSPATFSQPWIPMRVCQTLRTTILILLRHPVERGWSGFFYCQQARQFNPKPYFGGNRSEDVFHRFSLLDIEIARRCPARGSGIQFSACCARVAADHGVRLPWPGCFSTPACTQALVPPHRRFQMHLSGAYGQWCYTHVREGIYVWKMREWLTYHESVLVAKSEDFFENESAFLSELLTTLGITVNLSGRAHANAATAVGAHAHTMREDTRDILLSFYAPYNEELERLIGRKLNWN